MTLSRTQLILFAIAAVLLLIVGIAAGRGCAPTPAPPSTVTTGIDAGPGERIIDEQLDGAVQMDQVRMRQVEAKFDSDLRSFDEQQREEYERLRGGDDLEAAAQMLSEWNHRRRALKEDAGT